MPTYADFYIVGFGEHLGNNETDIAVPWATFKGNESTEHTFYIDGNPLEYDKYLLMQVLHVHSFNHEVKINGVALGGGDITKSPDPNKWNVALDWIDVPIHQGENTIQIIRASGGDNFVIGNVFIHWRETRTSWFFRLLPRWLSGSMRSGREGQFRKASEPIRLFASEKKLDSDEVSSRASK